MMRYLNLGISFQEFTLKCNALGEDLETNNYGVLKGGHERSTKQVRIQGEEFTKGRKVVFMSFIGQINI